MFIVLYHEPGEYDMLLAPQGGSCGCTGVWDYRRWPFTPCWKMAVGAGEWFDAFKSCGSQQTSFYRGQCCHRQLISLHVKVSNKCGWCGLHLYRPAFTYICSFELSLIAPALALSSASSGTAATAGSHAVMYIWMGLSTRIYVYTFCIYIGIYMNRFIYMYMYLVYTVWLFWGGGVSSSGSSGSTPGLGDASFSAFTMLGFNSAGTSVGSW